MLPDKNQFTDKNDVADAVAKIMNQTRQKSIDSVPTEMRDAAKVAGQEAKTAKTQETINNVYKKHFQTAAGDRTDLPNNMRQTFQDLADQERQS